LLKLINFYFILFLDTTSELSSVDNNDNIIVQTPVRKPRGRPKQTPAVLPSTSRVWRADDGKINNYTFNPDDEDVGLNTDLIDVLLEGAPFDFLKLIVDDKIILKMVEETNLYAQQKLSFSEYSTKSRLSKWTNTNLEEMHNWLGLILWMGLVQLPEISLYWSNSPYLLTILEKL